MCLKVFPICFWMDREKLSCFFFTNCVMREMLILGRKCTQLANTPWVRRCIVYSMSMRLPEVLVGLRERDWRVTGFHSSYSLCNLLSHWKWIEWNIA